MSDFFCLAWLYKAMGFFPPQSSDCFSVSPLDYKSYDPRVSQMNVCMLVALGVLVIFLLQTQPHVASYHHMVPRAASAMIGRLMTGSGSDLPPASAGLPAMQGASAQAVLADGDDKDEMKRKVMQWMKAHGSMGVVMCFAHWCPHCKNMMPIVADISQRNPSLPILLINCEALPASAFSGEAPEIVKIEYFPCLFVLREGTLVSIASPDEIEAMATAEVAEAAESTEEEKDAGEEEEETAEEANPFAKLF